MGSFFEPNHKYHGKVMISWSMIRVLGLKNLEHSNPTVCRLHGMYVIKNISGINNRVYPDLYIQLKVSTLIDMSQIQIIQSAFEQKQLKSICKCLELVSFDQDSEKIIADIEEVSPPGYLWAVSKNPAYFVQYQLKSAALLRIRSKVLIVWRPKYIEYPSYVKFPELREKKPNKLNLEFDPRTTTTENTNKAFAEFVENFYGTYFYSDPQFQTNLVTFSKHFISKITKHSYWHAIIDDSDALFISNITKMSNLCILKLSGLKENYNKTLYLFSFKGTKQGFFTTVKDKWMQAASFIAMIIIFYSIVGCDVGSTSGICAYRQQLTLSGAGLMLALIGVRYTQKGKKKKKVGSRAQQTQRESKQD